MTKANKNIVGIPMEETPKTGVEPKKRYSKVPKGTSDDNNTREDDSNKRKGWLTLNRATVKELMEEYPLIRSVEEMCIIRGCTVESLSDEQKEYAEFMIRQNIVKIKAKIKHDLFRQGKEGKEGNIKALTTLYQLIGDDDDLRRLGTTNTSKIQKNMKSEITIKSVDPEMVNKLKTL